MSTLVVSDQKKGVLLFNFAASFTTKPEVVYTDLDSNTSLFSTLTILIIQNHHDKTHHMASGIDRLNKMNSKMNLYMYF